MTRLEELVPGATVRGILPDNMVTVVNVQWFGSEALDASRVGRDAARIASELIAHLQALPGVTAKVTLEIETEIPNGASESTVRTLTENSRTLGFEDHGFGKE